MYLCNDIDYSLCLVTHKLFVGQDITLAYFLQAKELVPGALIRGYPTRLLITSSRYHTFYIRTLSGKFHHMIHLLFLTPMSDDIDYSLCLVTHKLYVRHHIQLHISSKQRSLFLELFSVATQHDCWSLLVGIPHFMDHFCVAIQHA